VIDAPFQHPERLTFGDAARLLLPNGLNRDDRPPSPKEIQMKALRHRALRRRLTIAVATGVAATVLFAPSALATMFSMNGSMEGDLKVDPGARLSIGYDLAVPGTHPR
jgi:hypothetical protein